MRWDNSLSVFMLCKFQCGCGWMQGSRSDIGSLVVMIFIDGAKVLYVQYLNSTVSLLPYFDCHVLWDKSTKNTYPAMIFLY